MIEITEQQLKQIENDAAAALVQAGDKNSLEAWRVRYIGRKGIMPLLLRRLKDLPAASKKRIGFSANMLRRKLQSDFECKQAEIIDAAIPAGVEVFREKLSSRVGHLHPITLAARRIQEIMASLGFLLVEGPEIEEEKYDFDALNIPLEHPTRTETDTFYIKSRQPKGKGLVLRTSTSAVQVRAVIEQNLRPPFAITSIGRVFRNEKPDPTHESTFHQVEALMIGKDISIANYKAISETLFSTYFGKQTKIRLRPGYFPFVEPGFEVDISCPFCRAQADTNSNCRACKGSRWIEMGGAGMVHPQVLQNMKIDPKHWQGFAWGYGIDRFAMLAHGITDLRLMWSGDIRFLRQFS